MDLQQIRTALKDAISCIDGLRVTDLRDDPAPPCAIVYPKTPIKLDLTFDGLSRPQFCVLILVPYVNTASAQMTLDAFLTTEGSTSVKAAIEADETLGGLVSSCVVEEIESYAVISLTDGGTRYLSAELVVEVWS